jgi:pilus assembly protein Flp/PilA
MTSFSRPFRANRRGAALVEYGILVGLVAVVAIGSVTVLGEKVADIFGSVGNSLVSTIQSDAEENTLVTNAFQIQAGMSGNWVGLNSAFLIGADSGNLVDSSDPLTAAITGFSTENGSQIAISFSVELPPESRPTGASCDNGMEAEFMNIWSVGTSLNYHFGTYTGPQFVAGETYACELTFD